MKCNYCEKKYKTKKGLCKHLCEKHNNEDNIEQILKDMSCDCKKPRPTVKKETLGEKKNKGIIEANIKVELPNVDETLIKFYQGKKENNIQLTPEDKVIIFECFAKQYKHIVNVGCPTQMANAYKKLFRYITNKYKDRF